MQRKRITKQCNSNGGNVMMTLDCTFAKHNDQQLINCVVSDNCKISKAQAYNFELWDMPENREEVCGCISAQRAHDWFVVVRKKKCHRSIEH